MSLTPEEIELLKVFTTNSDRSIFALRNLPEVVKGALFSRYSRSEKSLREILVKEFIDASWTIDGRPSDTSNEKAEAFYDRVLVGYGDDSVAELGGAHIACEQISNIASLAIEDRRLGISPLEKSTRYVAFDRQIDNKYAYYREPTIMASSYSKLYESTLDNLFATYSKLLPPLLEHLQQISPRDNDTSERAYASATKAKAFDLLRGLLPLATLTNVGLYGNGRAFEYLLIVLAASNHPELRDIGAAMQTELDRVIPSFVKRAKTDRGAEYARYLSGIRSRVDRVQKRRTTGKTDKSARTTTDNQPVELVDFDRDAEIKVVTAILYPHSHTSFAELATHVAGLKASEREEIIDAYTGGRQSRFHRPGRAFEEAYYTFDMTIDIGAYRDLHRHRVCTQSRQAYTVDLGYVVPAELIAAGLDGEFRAALDRTRTAYHTIAADNPIAAQYLVPFAYKIRARMRFNLREAYHLIELRSGRQGHPSYRAVAHAMYRALNKVHPTLVKAMRFVDFGDYDLERLAAEQKIDRQIEQKSD
jgi:thymidylate synthase ThyX